MNTACHYMNAFKRPAFAKSGIGLITFTLMLFISNALQAQVTPKYIQYNRMDSARKEVVTPSPAKQTLEDKSKRDRIEDSTTVEFSSKVEHSIFYEILKRFMNFDKD